MLRVTLYSRKGCHLCEDVLQVLQGLQVEFPFSLSVVDIDTDPSLRVRFQYLVPVVDFEGGVALLPPIDPDILRQTLQEELTRREGSR